MRDWYNYRKTGKHSPAGFFFVAWALLLMCVGCGIQTAPFKDMKGHIVPGSIATMETVIIGGIPQNIWLRGVSRSNPVLILLHGGPGASESALFRHYNSALEQHFLVVYWEQRGTGRSYHTDIPPESMTIDRLVNDLDELIELLRRRFDQDAVLAEEYFKTIKAPCKQLIWFEQSAHNPPFEEPGKFNQVLIEQILPIARDHTCFHPSVLSDS